MQTLHSFHSHVASHSGCLPPVDNMDTQSYYILPYDKSSQISWAHIHQQHVEYLPMHFTSRCRQLLLPAVPLPPKSSTIDLVCLPAAPFRVTSRHSPQAHGLDCVKSVIRQTDYLDGGAKGLQHLDICPQSFYCGVSQAVILTSWSHWPR